MQRGKQREADRLIETQQREAREGGKIKQENGNAITIALIKLVVFLKLDLTAFT